MRYYACSNIGRIREKNQDRCAIQINGKDQVLAVVCDGMGGHRAGEIAASVAITQIFDCFSSHPGFDDELEAKGWLKETIEQTHLLVNKMSATTKEHEGMGTTVVAALFIEQSVVIGYVGDSRAYFFTPDHLVQLTKDHTLLNALLDQGVLTKDNVESFDRKNILVQALGATPDLEVSLDLSPVQDGIYLLCSDGLHSLVRNDRISEIMQQSTDPKELTELLIAQANKNGGYDNISVIIINTLGRDK